MANTARVTEEYFTAIEVAKRFKVTRWTIYKLVDQGKLGAVHFGKSLRIAESHIEKYLAEQERKTATDNTVKNIVGAACKSS